MFALFFLIRIFYLSEQFFSLGKGFEVGIEWMLEGHLVQILVYVNYLTGLLVGELARGGVVLDVRGGGRLVSSPIFGDRGFKTLFSKPVEVSILTIEVQIYDVTIELNFIFSMLNFSSFRDGDKIWSDEMGKLRVILHWEMKAR